MTLLNKFFKIRQVVSLGNKKNVFKCFIILLVFISLKPNVFLMHTTGRKNDKVSLSDAYDKLAGFTVHGAILINGNSGFASCSCTVSGDGSLQNQI